MKPKLLIHIIDSLTFGGAEILLKNSISLLPQYRHLVLYLNRPDNLKTLFPAGVELECLNHRGWGHLLTTCRKINRIIKERQPCLVHAHLLNSTILARLSTPRFVPLVATVHSLYSVDAFSKNKKALWVERMTFRKQAGLIAVSQHVLHDYLHWVNYKGRTFVLYNFLPDACFEKRCAPKEAAVLKCIAIGNLKEAKNYPYLLQMFRDLKNAPVSLDIYGVGPLDQSLQKEIDEKGLNVVLKGHTQDVQHLLPQYDLFLQSSEHEGFGLSVIEAIAAKLPVLIAKIPVFEEITNGHAHFFPLNDAQKAAVILLELNAHKEKRLMHVNEAFEFAKAQFSEKTFVQQLQNIYLQLIENKNLV
jgi:glycosyltransferase involved in cell wall biosynthesis